MKSKKVFSHKSRLNIIKVVVLIAFILLLLTPVSSTSPQVDMYSMVTSLGVDSSELGVKCTAEVVLPEENKGAMGVSIVIDGDGQTLSSALENLSISIGRTLDLSHCAILVVGKQKAEKGVMDELEYLLSSSRVSPEISLVLSGNKDASEFITKLNAYSQKLDADNLLRYTDFGSHNYSQSLIQFVKGTYSRSNAAVMACIEMGEDSENQNAVEAQERPIKDDEDKKVKKSEEGGEEGGTGSGSGSGGSGGSGGESGGEGGEDPTIIRRTDKVGAFSGGRLKSIWGAKESNGLAWSDKKTKHGHMVLEDLEFNGQKVDKISCYLVKKKVRIRSKFVDNQPVLVVNVDAQFMVSERFKVYRLCSERDSGAVYDYLKSEIKKEIANTFESVLKSSKTDGVDALLARDYFYRYHKKQFDRMTDRGQDVLEQTRLEIKYDIKLN